MLAERINCSDTIQLTEADARKIVYIGPKHRLPDQLNHAISHEFADVDVIRLGTWEVALSLEPEFWEDVALVLLDEVECARNKGEIRQLRELAPSANFCSTYNGEFNSQQNMRACLAGGMVRSVLPMNLRLDIWLSAIGLMLSGGHYMPPDMIELINWNMPSSHGERHETVSASRSGSDNSDEAVALAMGRLTRRERDILKLAARGDQNKIIAAKCDLSEHTVKLHIHHIISKLGVSNRTEAAAAYFDYTAGCG